MNRVKQRRALSSRKMMIIILAALFVPLAVFFIGYHMITMKAVNERISATSKNVLGFFKDAVQFDLNKIEVNLAEIAANDNNFKKLLNEVSGLEAHEASYHIVNKSKTVLKLFPQIMGIYIYSPKNSIYRSAYSDGYKLAQKDAVENYLKEAIVDSGKPGCWYVEEISGSYYLIRILGIKQTYISCVVPVGELAGQEPMSQTDGYMVFSSEAGEPYVMKDFLEQEQISLKDRKERYYLSGTADSYFIVQAQMDWEGSTMLSYITKYEGIRTMMDSGWVVLMLLFLLLLSASVLCWRLLQKIYFRPLSQFVGTMNVIRAGGLDAKMEEDYMLQELNTVSGTFNSMVGEMKELKIQAYEREMEYQKVQLQRLQIQIRPHFFLNCLKNLYGMAQERKYLNIQDMLRMLSSHCRYILNDISALVSIEQEIQSVQNYISLQQISAAYSLECTCSVENTLAEAEIPRMSILTFVENTVKHAGSTGKGLKIMVKISRLSDGSREYIDITISDNGGGFPPELLDKMNKYTEEENMNGHIGIYNVKKRMELLYGKQGVVVLANRLLGAHVELFIPMDERNGAER